MRTLQTSHWHYLFGNPTSTGRLKQHPEDFVVTEILGYEPCGEGEHIYLWVEKEGLNTAFVAEQIAKFAQLPLRAITYAGRKDKHALTRQWIGVHKPGKHEYDWSQFELEGCRVLKAIRHNKKLRTGVLKGNQFQLTIRDFSKGDEFEARMDEIKSRGVPNYFGPQRFGQTRHGAQGGNLLLAERMLAGEPIKNRNKRSMVISALRSWLFNEFVSQRLAEDHFEQPLSGDAMSLAGSNSFFIADEITDDINLRLKLNDIAITAPMWGKGKLDTQSQATEFESRIAQENSDICTALEELGLKQERRPISVNPAELSYDIDGNTLTLSFELPSGSFATSVVRELLTELDGEQIDENSTE